MGVDDGRSREVAAAVKHDRSEVRKRSQSEEGEARTVRGRSFGVGWAAFALFLAAGARADQTPPAAPTTFEVPSLTDGIRVDGVLDEPAWAQAVVIEVKYEVSPGDNAPAPVRTQALLFSTGTHFIVGFRAFDHEPAKIRAHLTDRDSAFSDDLIGVILDTFNDERRGYEFFVNPLGVQADLVIDEFSEESEDETWDAIWDSAGRLTPDGYEVEIAIPFEQLRFQRVDGPQTWGVDLVRIWPRSNRVVIVSQPRDRGRSCTLCQYSKLRGFAGVEPGRNLELDPTVTGTASQVREEFPDGEMVSQGEDFEAGLTARWGITPNLTLLGALNPDFSQVEADAAQLDVNTQFALFYEEKRPFFLEGRDYYQTPIQAVYTRTVADPSWGVKVSGKEGRNAFGVYLAEDEVTNIIIPGVEESALTAIDASNLSGVVRYRRDVGRNSVLGVLFTGREGDGYSNQVFGFDGSLRLSDADTVSFQALGSDTEYPDELAAEYDQPVGSFSGQALAFAYEHDSRYWDWRVEYDDYDGDFRADAGFVPQVGGREADAGLDYTFWGEPEDWYSEIELGGEWERTEDEQGGLLNNEYTVRGEYSGPLQSFLFLRTTWQERGYRGERFDFGSWGLYGRIQPAGWLRLELDGTFGGQVDYANVREGDRFYLEPIVHLTPGRHLSLDLSYLVDSLDVEGGRLFTANLTQLRLVWQFSVRAFVRLVSQYADVERDPALYLEPVDARSQEWFNQLLFSYKINPQTVFFLGYSDNHEGFETGLERVDLTQRDRTIFVKIGYAWLL